MNGYVAFHKGRRTEVHAKTSYAAQKEAGKFFKLRETKYHEVTVVLAERDGQPVTHVADF